MLKGLKKKLAIASTMLLASAGVALAAFLITVPVGTNTVKAASANLEVTSSQINVEKLVIGTTSAPAPLMLKNTGSYEGNVRINITNISAPFCSFLSYQIDGDREGDMASVSVASVELGKLAPGETINLTRTVTLKPGSSFAIGECSFTETATLYSN